MTAPAQLGGLGVLSTPLSTILFLFKFDLWSKILKC